MSAAGCQDDGGAGVFPVVRREVDFDGRVVDVEDVDDGVLLFLEGGVVFFRLGDTGLVEERRVRRVERDHLASRQNGQRLERLRSNGGKECGDEEGWDLHGCEEIPYAPRVQIVSREPG